MRECLPNFGDETEEIEETDHTKREDTKVDQKRGEGRGKKEDETSGVAREERGGEILSALPARSRCKVSNIETWPSVVFMPPDTVQRQKALAGPYPRPEATTT